MHLIRWRLVWVLAGLMGWDGVASSLNPFCQSSIQALLARYQESLIKSSVMPDTALEIETKTNDLLHSLFTTTTGRVDGVLPAESLPEEYLQWAKREHSTQSPEVIEWDLVPQSLRVALLRVASTRNKQSFFMDRKIAGLRVKPEVELNFPTSMKIFGTTYPPGRHRVPLSSFMSPLVEYASHLLNPEHVEIHLRSKVSAGTLSEDARKFLSLLGLPQTHQHLHLVNPLPESFLKKDPWRHPLLLADHYRRVNLAAEMIGIVEDGLRVQSNIPYFDHLNRYALYRALDYWFQLANGHEEIQIGDDLKTAWVALHSSEKYETQKSFGYQVRSISDHTSPRLMGPFLDDLQKTLMTMNFGEGGLAFRRWLKRQPRAEFPKRFLDLHYESDYGGPDLPLGQSPPAAVQKFLNWDWERGSPTREELEAASPAAKKYLELASVDHDLKMLIHDWSQDPLFFEDLKAQKRIEEEQLKALQAVTSAEPVGAVMERFLRLSGLYRRVMESLAL